MAPPQRPVGPGRLRHGPAPSTQDHAGGSNDTGPRECSQRGAAHGEPTADVEHLPGDEAGPLVEEEAGRVRDVLGRTDPPDRYGLDDRLRAGGTRRVRAFEQLGGDRAGTERVHGDAVSTE